MIVSPRYSKSHVGLTKDKANRSQWPAIRLQFTRFRVAGLIFPRDDMRAQAAILADKLMHPRTRDLMVDSLQTPMARHRLRAWVGLRISLALTVFAHTGGIREPAPRWLVPRTTRRRRSPANMDTWNRQAWTIKSEDRSGPQNTTP